MLLWTFVYKFLCECMYSFLLGIYVGVKLLGHMVTVFNCLGSFPDYLPLRARHFPFPPAVYEGSDFYTSSPALIIVCHFDCSHPTGWSSLHLWFWFAFPWWLMMLSISSWACWPFVFFLKKFFLNFTLEYSWFTMLCQFQVYSKVIQLYIYIYLFFFRFFSHIGGHLYSSFIFTAA